MIEQGLTLMLVGMGTVFAFLMILVVAMSAMSSIVQRMTPEPSLADADATAQEVAAITAAIAQHRNRHE